MMTFEQLTADQAHAKSLRAAIFDVAKDSGRLVGVVAAFANYEVVRREDNAAHRALVDFCCA